MQLSIIPGAYGEESVGDGTASSWAVSEILQAQQYGLTYDGIMNNFKKPITREEFCVIAVKLYEQVSAKMAASWQNPFKDTTNPEVIKAYKLGIVNGTGGGMFSPGNSITRQELCTMVLRALKASIPNLSTTAPALSGYNDTGKIATWADPAVRFCVKNAIIKGVGTGLIDPLGNTTREQGIVIIKRTYESFKVPDYSGMPALEISSNPKSELTEKDKFLNLDLENRVSSPYFNTGLTLYVATGEGKPASFSAASYPNLSYASLRSQFSPAAFPGIHLEQPILNLSPILLNNITLKTGLRYSTTPFAFINSGGDLKRYFAYNLQSANASKVVWQVAKAPFNGYPNNWKKPAGLVASGEVAVSTKEFAIDFSKFVPSPTPPANLFQLVSGQLLFRTSSSYRELPREQRVYYVRAVPVDGSGNCIGDPGAGIPVLYGKPVSDTHLANIVQSSFELWYTIKPGIPSLSPSEFPNLFQHVANFIVGVSPGSSAYYFQPQKFDPGITKLTLQVSTVPFQGKPAEWEKPTGLVYSKEYDADKMPAIDSFKNCLAVPFSDFSPSSSALGKSKIVYYVRAVALKPSDSQPGRVVPVFSDTRIINYQNPAPITIYPVKTVTVPAYAPTMSFERYIPVRWEDYEWAHYYEVFRAPRWYEVNFKLSKKSGGVLYPYVNYMMQGMSTDQYENQLVPQFLVPGSGFKVVVKQEDESWWGDLWDGIVDFFSSIVNIISDVVNWASTTFNSLKMGIINTIAAHFPLIPDGWRDELTTALTALADYGLASIGIPPNIPNFDELTSGGLDYAITVAAQEAGIPANALTDAAKGELEKQIKNQASASTAVMGPNPLNCPFIKLDHRYQYRPAYVDVKLFNNKAKPTPTGTLRVRVEDENWPYFPVYEYVTLPVPSLQPNESMPIRVYLKEYMHNPYPGDVIWLQSDFYDMYWGNNGKKCKFDITIGYNLPDAKSAAHAAGLDKNLGECIAVYTYDKAYDGVSFTDVPCNEHYYWQQ
ncbi:MAG: S-layer homology domain-containing protein [Candidatus Aquicultor sp.]